MSHSLKDKATGRRLRSPGWELGGVEEMDEQGKTTFLEVWWEPGEERENGQQEAMIRE